MVNGKSKTARILSGFGIKYLNYFLKINTLIIMLFAMLQFSELKPKYLKYIKGCWSGFVKPFQTMTQK